GARGTPGQPHRPRRSSALPAARTWTLSPKCEQALGVLAKKARHRVQMPEVPACEEVLVDHGLVLVAYDRGRNPPPLPAGLHRAVAEIDVLDVQLVARIPAADLTEHRAAHEE